MPLIFAIFLSLLPLLAEEPSAFDAGNLNNPSPYGLTKTEQYILTNKTAIQTLKKDVSELRKGHFELRNNFNELKNSHEGFMSVAAGELQKVQKLRLSVEKLDPRFSEVEAGIQKLQNEMNNSVSQVTLTLEKNLEIQSENLAKLSSAMKSLSGIIDEINSNYVPGSQLQELREEMAQMNEKLTKIIDEPSYAFRDEENFKIYGDAIEMYNKKDYAQSEPRFKWSADHQYKPASSSFYLGQIAYAQKRYSNAIYYYKKSVSLYDKADYMPELLLNTAISFEKIKDMGNAKKFYTSVSAAFPDSKEAKTAKEALAKLTDTGASKK